MPRTLQQQANDLNAHIRRIYNTLKRGDAYPLFKKHELTPRERKWLKDLGFPLVGYRGYIWRRIHKKALVKDCHGEIAEQLLIVRVPRGYINENLGFIPLSSIIECAAALPFGVQDLATQREAGSCGS